jgi:hypothetical protein
MIWRHFAQRHKKSHDGGCDPSWVDGSRKGGCPKIHMLPWSPLSAGGGRQQMFRQDSAIIMATSFYDCFRLY